VFINCLLSIMISSWDFGFFFFPKKCFLVILGFELRALHLLGRYSTSWLMPPVLLFLVIFEMESCFLPKQVWTTVLLFYTFCHSWDDRYVTPCPAFPLRWGLEVRSSWSQPPNNQDTKITDMSHWCLAA
jgi:hypothetical protein